MAYLSWCGAGSTWFHTLDHAPASGAEIVQRFIEQKAIYSHKAVGGGMNNNQSKNHRQTTRKLVQKYKFQNKLRSKGYLEYGAQQYTHTVRERKRAHGLKHTKNNDQARAKHRRAITGGEKKEKAPSAAITREAVQTN